MAPYRVVVLGGGFGGLYAARALCARAPARVEVKLVEPAASFVFKPLLYELLTDELSEADIAIPYGRALEGTRVALERASVRAVDLARRSVLVSRGDPAVDGELSYDALVIALGAVPDLRGIEGLEGRALFATTLADFRRLRAAVHGILPGASARPPVVAICGAGPSGIEIALKLADGLGARERASRPRIVLCEAARAILPGFSEELKARALAVIEEKGVTIRTGAPVARADERGLVLRDGGGREERIDADLIVWTAGQRASAVVAGMAVDHAADGRILVPATLEVPGYPGVFALGDNARCAIEGVEAPPATAQVAVQQATVAARNVLARADGRTLSSYRYFPLAETLSLGRGRDILSVLGWKLEGRSAHIARRLVYVARLPGWREKAAAGARFGMELATGAAASGLETVIEAVKRRLER